MEAGEGGVVTKASVRLRRVMDRRYSAGIILLAIASTVTFLASTKLSERETHRAEAIALVANQRVLSQRIAFLVAALDEAPPAGREALRRGLRQATEEMRTRHDELTGRREGDADLSRFTAPIRGVYFAGFLPFDNDVRRFLDQADTIIAHSAEAATKEAAAPNDPPAEGEVGERPTSGPQPDDVAPIRAEVVAAGTNSMMQTHDLMVQIMKAEATLAVAEAQRTDTVLWACVLSLLVLITLGIFRPMSRQVERSVHDLVEAETRAVAAAASARRAKEAKGHFLQAASHELKTPLNAISGFADVLSAPGGEASPAALEQMQLASAHMAALLDTILDTHRADEGRLVLADEPFRLEEPLEAATGIARGLAERKALRFEAMVELPDDLVVRGDPGRLRQICLNLLDNAVKFTTEGGVRFEAYTEGEAEARMLVVLVTDTGCGIAEDRQQAAFERFSAEGDVLSRGGGGLGVGLALTREIAELMGGEIALRSRLGAGTQVEVAVPLIEARLAPPALEAPTARLERVLIVDDNLPNRMVADALIKPFCDETVHAADGAAAVEACAAAAFDLVLMDISMPVMNGIEATQRLRGAPGPNQDTVIVAVTAHVAKDEAGALLEEGFDEVVHKPVRRETIENGVRRWGRAKHDRRTA